MPVAQLTPGCGICSQVSVEPRCGRHAAFTIAKPLKHARQWCNPSPVLNICKAPVSRRTCANADRAGTGQVNALRLYVKPKQNCVDG